MTSTEKMSLSVAILAIVGGAISTVLSGKYQTETVQAQIQNDIRLAQVQALEKREQLIREKYEALVVEMSDIVSYLDANNTFPVAVAKDHLAKCRRAAFALSAHAGPSLSLAALAVVEATNFAFASNSQGIAVIVKAAKDISTFSAKMRLEFDKELSVFATQRMELIGAH